MIIQIFYKNYIIKKAIDNKKYHSITTELLYYIELLCFYFYSPEMYLTSTESDC